MSDMESASALVKGLRNTFASGKTRSYQWRVSQLKSILKLCSHEEKAIVGALYEDLSKPEHESTIYEISLLKNSCTIALKELKHWMSPQMAETPFASFPSSAEIISEPLGVVLIISSWNYPFLLSLDPVIGAIAAGNTVVMKPSEISPAASSLLAKLVTEYLDESSIKVVEGSSVETTTLLEQKWDKIFYTGNGRVGRIIMAAAARNLTPVLLELGGKTPVIVDSDINLQVTARRIIVGKWGCNNGQSCVSPDYIITTKDYSLKLVDALKSELLRFYGENPLESKDLSRIVNLMHFSRLARLLDEDKVCSKIVYGGKRDENSLRIAPTILLDVSNDTFIMREEIFGPLLPIQTVNNIVESFDVINAGTKPLAAYLFTNNKKLKKQFVMSVSAGGLVVNDTAMHVVVHTLPFGGVGESGFGAYHGKFSFDAFSHKKSVMYRNFAIDLHVRYPPYTTWKQRLSQALLRESILGIIFALLGWSRV